MLLAPALAAFSILSLLVAVRWLSVRQRTQRLVNLELRPNCLLTRSPIVFVTGRRSLFYFLNYWNEIPGFLREHGYEVQVYSLPWRGSAARYQSLNKFLEKAVRPVHLIADSSSRAEVERLLLTKRGRLASFNFAEEITGKSHLQHAIGLKSDRQWTIESKYLDHAIQLAESEH